MEQENFTPDITDTIIREYYEQLYANRIGQLEDMHKLLETYILPKLNQKI